MVGERLICACCLVLLPKLIAGLKMWTLPDGKKILRKRHWHEDHLGSDVLYNWWYQWWPLYAKKKSYGKDGLQRENGWEISDM